MTRLFITGGPGSGKTTLAKRLSAQLSLPGYELDLIGWENGVGLERPPDIRLRDIHEIAVQPGWIAEGGLHLWAEELLEHAEQIVWLDLAWPVARRRILSRHMRASLAGTNKHRGLLKLYRFMGYARSFYTATELKPGTRLAVGQKLQPFSEKVIYCKTPAEVEAFFSQITAIMR